MVMMLAAFGIVPIVKASILGAILLVVSRSISIQDSYEAISWPVIFLIAFLIPIGSAIQSTELDLYLGEVIILLESHDFINENP